MLWGRGGVVASYKKDALSSEMTLICKGKFEVRRLIWSDRLPTSSAAGAAALNKHGLKALNVDPLLAFVHASQANSIGNVLMGGVGKFLIGWTERGGAAKLTRQSASVIVCGADLPNSETP
jgi:hypothetical protein